MDTANPRYELRLEARTLFEIPDIAEVHIRCTQGNLWITLDHDPRDIVLEAGQALESAEHRRALVYALSPSRLTLKAAGQRAASRSPTLRFAPAPNLA